MIVHQTIYETGVEVGQILCSPPESMTVSMTMNPELVTCPDCKSMNREIEGDFA